MARDAVEYSYRVRGSDEDLARTGHVRFLVQKGSVWEMNEAPSIILLAHTDRDPVPFACSIPNCRLHNSLRTSRRSSNLIIHDAEPCECFLRPQHLKPLFPPQSGPRIQLPMCIPRTPRSIAPSPIPHSHSSSSVPLTGPRRRARPVRTRSRFEHRR